MSRYALAILLARFKNNKKITIEKFFDELSKINTQNGHKPIKINRISKKSRCHELAHANVWGSRNIKYNFFTSKDGPSTAPETEDLHRFVKTHKLTKAQLISLLKEAFSAPLLIGEKLDGKDKLCLEVLNGKFKTFKQINAFDIANRMKNLR